MSWRRMLKHPRAMLILFTLLAAALGSHFWRLGPPSAEDGDAFQVRILVGHACPVRAVAFSPEGTTLASGAGGPPPRGEVRLWDVATGESRRSPPERDDTVMAVAFSPDGALLATAGWFQPLHLWDTATGHERAALPGELLILGLAFCP